MRRAYLTSALLAGLLYVATPVQAQDAHNSPLLGAWEPHTYFLEDGTKHDVTGLIFFTEHHWTVLFFVLGDDRKPKRGSAEGGTYELSGNQLVFTHRYHFSSGEAVQSLPASPLRMEISDASSAPTEPSGIEIEGDDLVIYFPSGNSMAFVRSDGNRQ